MGWVNLAIHILLRYKRYPGLLQARRHSARHIRNHGRICHTPGHLIRNRRAQFPALEFPAYRSRPLFQHGGNRFRARRSTYGLSTSFRSRKGENSDGRLQLPLPLPGPGFPSLAPGRYGVLVRYAFFVHLPALWWWRRRQQQRTLNLHASLLPP